MRLPTCIHTHEAGGPERVYALLTSTFPLAFVGGNRSKIVTSGISILINDAISIQESAKGWSLGCVKRDPAAREDQDAGITQPRDHYLADPCKFSSPVSPQVLLKSVFVVSPRNLGLQVDSFYVSLLTLHGRSGIPSSALFSMTDNTG